VPEKSQGRPVTLSLPDRSNPGCDSRIDVGRPATGALRSRCGHPTEERRSTVLRLDLDRLARSRAFGGAVKRDRMIGSRDAGRDNRYSTRDRRTRMTSWFNS
jgi:hypothetical protein